MTNALGTSVFDRSAMPFCIDCATYFASFWVHTSYTLLMSSKTSPQTRRKCLLAIVHFIRSQDHFSYES